MLLFMVMFETMLEGLLRGWRKAKPAFKMDTNIEERDWEILKLVSNLKSSVSPPLATGQHIIS
jgi:hypothetical protein